MTRNQCIKQNNKARNLQLNWTELLLKKEKWTYNCTKKKQTSWTTKIYVTHLVTVVLWSITDIYHSSQSYNWCTCTFSGNYNNSLSTRNKTKKNPKVTEVWNQSHAIMITFLTLIQLTFIFADNVSILSMYKESRKQVHSNNKMKIESQA